MARSGRSSHVRIGVAKDSTSGFEAHAWVEHEGDTLLSDSSDIERYTPLLILERGQA
jgi:hypothetical protein